METYPIVCGYYIKRPQTRNSTQEYYQSTAFLSSSSTRSEAHSSTNENPDASRFPLSYYLSSRGSENSFVDDHQKNISGGGVNSLVNVEEDTKEECFDDMDRGLWWRYCSFRRSNNSFAWISFQLIWRLLLSLAVALFVFYCATKPPPPKVSIQVKGIREFRLGEGVDAHGVATKVLTSNIALNLLIENKSKLFRLHIHSPIIEISFRHLRFGYSNGPKLLADTYASNRFELNVRTRNKPMYGAGRTMQDMMQSGRGLPLLVHVSFSSNFRVVGELIKPKFHHVAECVLVVNKKYDTKYRTQKYRSSCRTIAS